jgi:rhamnulokinase
MVGQIGQAVFSLTEAHRFGNASIQIGQTLHWDILALYRGMLDGLRAAGRPYPLASIGIDSWAIDYGLLDSTGALIGNPVSYRDARTDGVMDAVLAKQGAGQVYATTGLQNLPFNTIYQLVASRHTPAMAAAAHLLLVPDLLGYWLTGVVGAELTNASTTQLLDVTSRDWARGLMARLQIPASVFPPIRAPGSRLGFLLPQVAAETGLDSDVSVFAVGSHDTASAVVGVPAADEAFAYISCGTWSLVGVELDAPVLTEASRAANFTNELGVDGTVRYLRNVMGLWLLQESLRRWETDDLSALLAQAAEEPPFAAVVDPDDPSFLPPGDIPARIAAACVRTGQPAPASRAATVRCIVESLALAHRRSVRQASQLSGRDVSVVHVVGGGARNALLCQLTADACDLPVLAGPVEATAWGNALVQARALGAVSGDLRDLRALLSRHTPLTRYEPRSDASAWDRAEARLLPRDAGS